MPVKAGRRRQRKARAIDGRAQARAWDDARVHQMSTPITDTAEVSIDFPDKFFVGSFGRGSAYRVTADEEGVHIHLERREGEKRHVGFHIHYALLAEILGATADAVQGVKKLEPHHVPHLQEAARKWLGKS